ncbi:MAG: threonine ammonia-lyase [Bacilli bacterium]|nr:threonine ammonia-lyase [Bacilli bacterium]
MITLQRIQQAAAHLQSIIHYTPLEYSHTFSQITGTKLYLKLENLQKTGSFKIRGASYKISTLTEAQRKKGVIAASAGNHAQGVAFASRSVRIPCTIVMPETAPLAKIEATTGYGAQVVLAGSNYDEAYKKACEIQLDTGATFIHAFDDLDVIAGQATIGLEILQQLQDCEAVVIPVGGGGLIAGAAAAIKLMRPEVSVIGVEAAGAACMRAALLNNAPVLLDKAVTVADGILVRKVGDHPFALTKQYVDQIVTVEDEAITKTMLMLIERNKYVVEGAGATGLAALLSGQVDLKGKKTVVLLSGGNVDVHLLSRIMEHGLVEAGRYLRLATKLSDQPGEILQVLEIIASQRANVISIQHHRHGESILLGQAEVEIDLETRNKQHTAQILESLEAAGYHFIIR